MATIFWINRGTALRESSLEARANIYNVYNDKCLAVFNAASRLKCHRRNVQTRRVVSRYYSFDLRNYPTDTRQSIDTREIPFLIIDRHSTYGKHMEDWMEFNL